MRLPFAPVEYVRSRVEHCGMQFLPIGLHHVASLEGLPWHTQDPFDRLLVAQALAEGVPILTSDKKIQAYSVQRIW
ncbi:MAG: type II toxin-antitoxin system VapC family toxin [Acidobacteriia bacterium]|nr:type II toxin-antitoxin system VapC family toxin [Terriglobia bacterium]